MRNEHSSDHTVIIVYRTHEAEISRTLTVNDEQGGLTGTAVTKLTRSSDKLSNYISNNKQSVYCCILSQNLMINDEHIFYHTLNVLYFLNQITQRLITCFFVCLFFLLYSTGGKTKSSNKLIKNNNNNQDRKKGGINENRTLWTNTVKWISEKRGGVAANQQKTMINQKGKVWP